MKPRGLAGVLPCMIALRFTRFRGLLLGSLLAATAALHGADGGFAATLSADQQAAAGLTTLSPVEQLTLDQLVAGELSSVRRADATELTGSFISRRTEAERQAAGLARLSAPQIEKLNEFVAAALAAHPRPKERPRLKDSDVLAAKPIEIHGEVTVGYGWGGGGTVRYGSLMLNYYDPNSRVGISIGVAQANGSGLYGFYPGYYGYGGYYDASPFLSDTPYRDLLARDDFSYSNGQSFRSGYGDFSGRGWRRH